MTTEAVKKTKRAHAAGKRPGGGAALGRTVRFLFKSYPVLVPFTAFCILFSAIVAAVPAIFTQKIYAVIDTYLKAGNTDWGAAFKEIMPLLGLLIAMYVLAVISTTLFNQLGAYITQGFLCKLRRKMFDGMQDLPIKYFDTHKHGDIMSYYTNDIDTLRQLVSQSLPSLLQSIAVALAVLAIMLYYSVWMTLLVLAGVAAMILVSRVVGGGSARFFVRQQKAIGRTEGFVQEMMNGQKVV